MENRGSTVIMFGCLALVWKEHKEVKKTGKGISSHMKGRIWWSKERKVMRRTEAELVSRLAPLPSYGKNTGLVKKTGKGNNSHMEGRT